MDKNVAQDGTVGKGRQLVSFGNAIHALKDGKRVQREGWNGKGLFAFMQVPALVPEAIIPKMSSLPQSVKNEFIQRGGDIRYSNQMALVDLDSNINSWVPSASDTLANDWIILD
jgi:hypothetical protein